MFRAYGLYGHIQANRLRSALLLAGFVALLHALLFSLLLVWSAFLGGTLDEIVAGAGRPVAPPWARAPAPAPPPVALPFFVHPGPVSPPTPAQGGPPAPAPPPYKL